MTHDKKEKPHVPDRMQRDENAALHQQHRARMWQRYLRKGIDAFSEVEQLEMLLFGIIPRKNTNEIAHRLLKTFGDLHHICAADTKALTQIEGVGERVALYLKFMYDIHCVLERQRIHASVPLSETDAETALISLLVQRFYGANREQLLVVFLEGNGRYQGEQMFGVGIGDALEVSFQAINREVVLRGCHHVVIAHNHPNGRLYPSEEDLLFTQKLSRELKHIGAELVAHYLISGRNYLKIDIHLRTFSGSLTPLVCGEMQQDRKPIEQTHKMGQTDKREKGS